MWGKQKSNADTENSEDMKKTQPEETNPSEKDPVSTEKMEETSGQNSPKSEKEEEVDVKQLLDQVKQLEGKAAESERLRLLALADMDNQRKRHAKEMENLRYNVTQDTLFPFLQVFDHFTMAVSASESTVNVDALKKGMEMIQQEFDKAFSDLGVEKIDAQGKEFDPKQHEAVAQEASDTVPSGHVIRQWNFGYRIGERLLKPAMVIVSSGKAEKTQEVSEKEVDRKETEETEEK